jgi:hypothetical protein
MPPDSPYSILVSKTKLTGRLPVQYLPSRFSPPLGEFFAELIQVMAQEVPFIPSLSV